MEKNKYTFFIAALLVCCGVKNDLFTFITLVIFLLLTFLNT